MLANLSLRPAEEKDLPEIVGLFLEDEFGATREALTNPLAPSYRDAFQAINPDKNQIFFVVENKKELIATCHLTFMPSFSF